MNSPPDTHPDAFSDQRSVTDSQLIPKVTKIYVGEEVFSPPTPPKISVRTDTSDEVRLTDNILFCLNKRAVYVLSSRSVVKT